MYYIVCYYVCRLGCSCFRAYLVSYKKSLFFVKVHLKIRTFFIIFKTRSILRMQLGNFCVGSCRFCYALKCNNSM